MTDNNMSSAKCITTLAHPVDGQGYFFLNENKIVHVLPCGTRRVVVEEPGKCAPNWFGSFCKENDDLFWFPKTCVLMLAFLGGDHDYIWWFHLGKYNQNANLDNPAYWNGAFNDVLYLRKYDDRYAIGTHCMKIEKSEDSDADDSEEYDNYEVDSCDDSIWENNANQQYLTIIFDTATMAQTEYTTDQMAAMLAEVAAKTKQTWAAPTHNTELQNEFMKKVICVNVECE